MRLIKKTFVNIAVGLVIIGIALMLAGVAFGGRLLDFGSGDTTSITDEFEDVGSLVIEIDAGSLRIERGEGFAVKAEDVYESAFESSLKDGVLTIRNKIRPATMMFGNLHLGLFPWTNPKSVVTVYIPDDATLEIADLTVGAGKIAADGIRTGDIRIKVGAGEVVIDGLEAEDSTLDCGVGSIRINGAITGESTIRCGVGEIRLDLEGDPKAYDYRIKVGLGSTRINDDIYSGSTDKTEKNDGATGRFDLDCGVGEIVLNIGE